MWTTSEVIIGQFGCSYDAENEDLHVMTEGIVVMCFTVLFLFTAS